MANVKKDTPKKEEKKIELKETTGIAGQTIEKYKTGKELKAEQDEARIAELEAELKELKK